jgi:hypothetical protein
VLPISSGCTVGYSLHGLTPGMLLIWSVLVVAHVGAKNYAGMLVLRFLLGMAEEVGWEGPE